MGGKSKSWEENISPSHVPTISNSVMGSGNFNSRSSIFAELLRLIDNLSVVSGQSLAQKQETLQFQPSLNPSSRFHSGSRKAKSGWERPEDDNRGGGDDLLGLRERHGRLACFSRSRARCWTGEVARKKTPRVWTSDCTAMWFPSPTPPHPVRFIPPSAAYLSWRPDENERFSLSAAAARVDGPAVHAKPQECTHAWDDGAPVTGGRTICGRLIDHSRAGQQATPAFGSFAGRSCDASAKRGKKKCRKNSFFEYQQIYDTEFRSPCLRFSVVRWLWCGHRFIIQEEENTKILQGCDYIKIN